MRLLKRSGILKQATPKEKSSSHWTKHGHRAMRSMGLMRKSRLSHQPLLPRSHPPPTFGWVRFHPCASYAVPVRLANLSYLSKGRSNEKATEEDHLDHR